MKYFNLCFALVFSAYLLHSQGGPAFPNRCGTEVPTQQWEAEFQKLIHADALNKAKKQPALRTIPVIIHVVHNGVSVGQYPNLSQAQLISQIKVLNDDYAGIGYNNGNYNPQAFSTWAAAQNISSASLDAFGRIGIANCYVEFCLAVYDTAGNILPEPGIERINCASRGWSDPAQVGSYAAFKSLIDNTIKPQTMWNAKKYLNIWVTDENLQATGGLLGYSTFPPPPVGGLQGLSGAVGTATNDGLWCYAGAFGSIDGYPAGIYVGTNNRGRTASHEIGHYLGLRHIWGDGYCADDFCSDTPPATDKNFYTPAYPLKVNGCQGNSPDGEMFMNFMDYTDDNWKYMFTNDQAIRIQTVLLYSPLRSSLGTHNLCTVAPIAASAKFKSPTSFCSTTSMLTMTNQTTGTPVPNYTWNVSGNAIVYPNINSPIVNIGFSAGGNYVISLTADNGTLSTVSKTVTVYKPMLHISGADTVVCQGRQVVLTATGANSYTWFPDGIIDSTIVFNSDGDNTFSVVAAAAPGCSTSSVITYHTMDCTGLIDHIENVSGAAIIPNPTKGSFTISGSIKAEEVTVRSVDGNIVLQRSAEELKSSLDASALPAGIYFVELLEKKQIQRTLKLVKE